MEGLKHAEHVLSMRNMNLIQNESKFIALLLAKTCSFKGMSVMFRDYFA